ncbi:hypothetical protein [Acetobacterium tundrae]|uniref:Uncharacterized protein n=1 Tax=Acetobacterium tundrae TaxID=132932 RepID=A0ABR6WK19_9FIRM|nr:hypothetical protein [Acetobacterium tundrae]MBC3796777.1 hypothetical protein [Acetobacterium tundrae]
MKKLTRREKLLIYILICFAIGSGGIYFVAIPCYQRYAVVDDQATEAGYTQQTMEMAINSIPVTMTAQDAAKAKLAAVKGPFSAHLPNEGIDALLTQLCLSYNLAPTSLAIESNAMQELLFFEAYSGDATGAGGTTGTSSTTGSNTTTGTSSTTGSNTTAGTSSTTGSNTTAGTSTTTGSNTTTDTSSTTGASTTGSSSTTTGTSTGSSTWTSVVTMALTGTQTNFYQLLDAVAARPDMIISSFTIAPATTTTTVSSVTNSSSTTSSYTGWTPVLDGGNITISVTFEVYMVDK